MSLENNNHTRFPKHVILIILNELCERFSYYGLRTVLILYLTQFIKINDNTATAYYHAFTMICYFTPVIGAIISDGYIGKFRTILYISIVYCIGELILSLTAMKPLGAPNLIGPLVGLTVIGLGTGGIKPCVSAFGGDQFKNEQKKHLDTFFSMFYLSINIGAFIGSLVTPILRKNVKCFDDDCYPLAFGVPSVLMFISIIIFLIGKPLYQMRKVDRSQNLLVKLIACILHAVRIKFKNRKSSYKKNHWLDYAQDKYDDQFIKDVKAFSKVVFMFLPLPIFWALFDQQGSRWTLQAQRLDSHIANNFYIQADQIQSINPVFILILIPTFNWIIYPIFEKCKLLKKPLQRMTIGMFLACCAFLVSAFLEHKIQSAFINKNSSPNSIHLLNLTPLDINLNTNDFNAIIETSNQLTYTNRGSDVNKTFTLDYNNLSANYDFESSNEKYFKNNYLLYSNKDGELQASQLLSSIIKEPVGKSELRIYYLNSDSMDAANYEAKIQTKSGGFKSFLNINNIISNSTLATNDYKEVDYDEYELLITNKITSSSILTILRLDNGARNTFIFYNTPNGLKLIKLIDIYGNQINFLYQLIQYFILTSAEIMFSVSGLSFAYSQAPESMKSVLQAAWLLTVAFGNLIVVIIAEANFLPNQVYEYILFAALIFIFAIVFALMSFFYVYKESSINLSREDASLYSDDELTSLFSHENESKQTSADQLIGMNSIEE